MPTLSDLKCISALYQRIFPSDMHYPCHAHCNNISDKQDFQYTGTVNCATLLQISFNFKACIPNLRRSITSSVAYLALTDSNTVGPTFMTKLEYGINLPEQTFIPSISGKMTGNH